jgi:pimeloyl-ACP methyl ester carboxylesterase
VVCADSRGTGAASLGDLVGAGQAALPVATPAAQEAAMAAWHGEEQPRPAAGAPRALAVCGTADVVIPPANAERLAARWPSCRVERVAGAGHAVMAEAPDRVARLVGSLGG